MTFQEIFTMLKETFMEADVREVKGHYAFQFDITGEGAGVFYVEISDGKLHVEPYDYEDRDVRFQAQASTYFKLVEGKTDPIFAYTTGKLKVDGDLGKALAIQKILKNK